jgi:hypothetical protein
MTEARAINIRVRVLAKAVAVAVHAWWVIKEAR